MTIHERWTAFTARFDFAEAMLSRKFNPLIFLVIRFLLMSAMVVGFSWYALDLHP